VFEFKELGFKVEEVYKSKLDFRKDILKKTPKRTKEELRTIEPGFKIGTGQFQSVSKWCDNCECVAFHCHKVEKRKFICIKCKIIKIY